MLAKRAMFVSNQKEQFSLAFIHAVASVAGFKISRCDVDDDSVDIEIVASRTTGTLKRAPHLEIQAKCTETDNGRGPTVAFPLKLKNYEDLRDAQVHVPRILVLMTVPKKAPSWIRHSPLQLAMRKCAYWLSLRGAAPTANTTVETVHIPRSQTFTVASLTAMIDRIGDGGLP